jgi:hypothetical protein
VHLDLDWGPVPHFCPLEALQVHLDTIKVFIYQLMHNRIALKRILKFTLKQLLHVSVQLSSGSVLFELAKVTVVKIIN